MELSIENLGSNAVRVVFPDGTEDQIGPGEVLGVDWDGAGEVALRELGLVPGSDDPAQQGGGAG